MNVLIIQTNFAKFHAALKQDYCHDEIHDNGKSWTKDLISPELGSHKTEKKSNRE